MKRKSPVLKVPSLSSTQFSRKTVRPLYMGLNNYVHYYFLFIYNVNKKFNGKFRERNLSPASTKIRKLVVICSKLISAVSHIDWIAKRSRTRIRTWLIDVLTEHNTTICTVQQLDFQHLVGILRIVSHFCQFVNSLYGNHLAVSLAACLILERVLRRFELPIFSSHVPHSDRGQLFAWDLKVHLFL
jgi:hypothetical protein